MKVGPVVWLWFIGLFSSLDRGRFTVQWTKQHAQYVRQINADETQVFRGGSQTEDALLIVTESWPITRSQADRVQMRVTHWLLGLKSCRHEWRAEGANRSWSRCSVCDPARRFGLVFRNGSRAVISIIVLIYDEIPLVAVNYCILEPVEDAFLLSDQPFCQHQ